MKDLYKVGKGLSTRPKILSMITGPYARRRKKNQNSNLFLSNISVLIENEYNMHMQTNFVRVSFKTPKSNFIALDKPNLKLLGMNIHFQRTCIWSGIVSLTEYFETKYRFWEKGII